MRELLFFWSKSTIIKRRVALTIVMEPARPGQEVSVSMVAKVSRQFISNVLIEMCGSAFGLDAWDLSKAWPLWAIWKVPLFRNLWDDIFMCGFS